MVVRLPKLLPKLPKLSSKPGVYLFKNNRQVLYIGKANNLKKRVQNHLKRGGAFIEKADKISWKETPSEIDALILEAELIKKYKPKYNVVFRDDKNYFFVGLTREDFPRLSITHQRTDIGPLTNGQTLKIALKILRKKFPYRACKNLKKPCLYYYLKLCPAHPPTPKNRLIYRKNLKKLFKELPKQYLELLKYKKIEQELQKLLKTKQKISRIEAYDISNIQGLTASGSMVVFEYGQPKKEDYRIFKIKTVFGANDVAMIKEVLERRLKHQEWPRPNLILIDGGRAQLNAALEMLHSPFPGLLALAKKKEELYTVDNQKPIPSSSLSEPTELLLLRLRDEAHRFAVKYHRKLRNKAFFYE